MPWVASHRSTSIDEPTWKVAVRAGPARHRPSPAARVSTVWCSGVCSGPAADDRHGPRRRPRHAAACSQCGRTNTALDAFLADEPRSPDVGVTPRESWHVRLRRIGGHGTLEGCGPARRGSRTAPPTVAPLRSSPARRCVARSWRAFSAASDVVDAELHAAHRGSIDVVGIGEDARRLGWRRSACGSHSAPPRNFAYAMPDHVEVMRRTRAAGLVRRGDVRPVRALRLERHLERTRPAGSCGRRFVVVSLRAHR
jgi:hypothetical protein